MANLTRTTREHDEIRRWAEERGGKPSHVKRTGSGEDVGILRIDFPGYSGEGSLEPITWEQWFDKFDDQGLALIYEEETAGGARSNFNKIVTAETAKETETKSHGRKSTGLKSKGVTAKKTAVKKAVAGKKAAASKKAAPASKTASKGASKKVAKKVAPKATKKSAGKKTASKKTATKKTAAKKRR